MAIHFFSPLHVFHLWNFQDVVLNLCNIKNVWDPRVPWHNDTTLYLLINSVLGRNLEAPRLIQFESLTYAMRISIIVSTAGAHKHSRVQAVLSRYYMLHLWDVPVPL